MGGDEGLRSRLNDTTGKKKVPLIFLGGRLVGGLADIEALERSGDLDRLGRVRV